ncbi:MAG: hypothetical protein LBP85_09800 [Prevotellaceae bacterium]|jgi:hypothetical protein|nr:hypothetical protein [Prevotellaceae bacterium]
MKKLSLLLILSIFAISHSFEQEIPNEYYKFINEADSLYKIKEYKMSAFAYSAAMRANNGKALIHDRYNAACSWALANNPDSAFYHLNILADNKYSYYSSIVTDSDLFSLHNDKRWKYLLETIKRNKRENSGMLNCVNDKQDDEDAKKSRQEIKSYNLNVKMNVKNKTVTVDGFVTIYFNNTDSLDLVLWGKTKINTITYNNKSVDFTFDTLSKSKIMYIPDGRMLTLVNPDKTVQTKSIYFNYECNMQNVEGWGRSFTGHWIELGYYTAWYPVHAASGKFTSSLQISIDEPYKVSGSGVVIPKGNQWEMTQTWEGFDNIIIASKNLKSRKIQIDNTVIEIIHTDFPQSDIDSVFVEFKNVFDFYENIYGQLNKNEGYLKFVLCPVEGGGGYSRKNYISLKTNRFTALLGYGIAHEMAHFWWNSADATTWHDWINEAFAEYSMLLYIKEKSGQYVFDSYLDAYRVNAEYSCPVWAIDRDTPEAYTALYEKGSVMLYDLEQKIGTKAFLKFIRHILSRNIKTTNEFLKTAENDLGTDISNWIESKLKMTSYE